VGETVQKTDTKGVSVFISLKNGKPSEVAYDQYKADRNKFYYKTVK